MRKRGKRLVLPLLVVLAISMYLMGTGSRKDAPSESGHRVIEESIVSLPDDLNEALRAAAAEDASPYNQQALRAAQPDDVSLYIQQALRAAQPDDVSPYIQQALRAAQPDDVSSYIQQALQAAQPDDAYVRNKRFLPAISGLAGKLLCKSAFFF
uniref:Uncharacterized protein n=1 Tax=Branchiostoma floridae TaxID=7739 RepID=C3ZT45_BRAFL|eukprot:XP_002588240.1 hypothetical protein BRAFLDRAFT_86687 [Branchiostoma floridae]